mmetsp:Transcript_14332/g.23834  ORF Transcript_14332/g.23834 Transcript_14332/m.23834 type:complete len:174 (+) Transcript_14332:37-558(+)
MHNRTGQIHTDKSNNNNRNNNILSAANQVGSRLRRGSVGAINARAVGRFSSSMGTGRNGGASNVHEGNSTRLSTLNNSEWHHRYKAPAPQLYRGDEHTHPPLMVSSKLNNNSSSRSSNNNNKSKKGNNNESRIDYIYKDRTELNGVSTKDTYVNQGQHRYHSEMHNQLYYQTP